LPAGGLDHETCAGAENTSTVTRADHQDSKKDLRSIHEAITRLKTAAALSAAAIGITAAVFAAPASAAPTCSSLGFPGSDPAARCARVIGINPGSYLGSRPEPRYGTPIINRFYNGDIIELDCWTTGDGAADNPSYKYWIGLHGGSSPQYVNDWYLDSGSPSVWMQQLPAADQQLCGPYGPSKQRGRHEDHANQHQVENYGGIVDARHRHQRNPDRHPGKRGAHLRQPRLALRKRAMCSGNRHRPRLLPGSTDRPTVFGTGR
jgi:hypothetical protein